jgi:hypothetical protein
VRTRFGNKIPGTLSVRCASSLSCARVVPWRRKNLSKSEEKDLAGVRNEYKERTGIRSTLKKKQGSKVKRRKSRELINTEKDGTGVRVLKKKQQEYKRQRKKEL